MSITCKGRTITPGVVYGSHHGHYVGLYAVQEALYYGWEDSDAERAASEYVTHYYRDDWEFALEVWDDIVTDAVDWLNDNTQGGVWHFWDGDFRVDTEDDYETEELFTWGYPHTQQF